MFSIVFSDRESWGLEFKMLDLFGFLIQLLLKYLYFSIIGLLIRLSLNFKVFQSPNFFLKSIDFRVELAFLEMRLGLKLG